MQPERHKFLTMFAFGRYIAVKTYVLPAVKAELDEYGIKPRIAILVHNGIVKPVFPTSVRVVGWCMLTL